MTKKEIVKQIAEKFDESQTKVKEIVQGTFDLIIATLVEEGRIELRNFGVFEVKRRKSRRARNPRTNQPVEVEAKNVVTFQPGKVMEERVRTAKMFVEPKRRASKSTLHRGSKYVPPVEVAPPPPAIEADEAREPVLASVGSARASILAEAPDHEFGGPNKPR